ncbi:prepilin peptidase [Micrococcus antarcticus]|uniref:prepilin peptidase n=1 Tax=Micrococcus antarcticus TaxID=86171 RepID=UPI00261277E5|nr:prepilin peptidase [uncultured Micrococcus sp.]
MGWWAWAVAAGHITTAAVWVLAVAWFALCCAVLVRTDLREHRLPNRWTLRLALGGLVGMAGGAALAGRWDLVAGGMLGGLGYAVAMFVLHLLSGGGLGMGDVKLAAGLGLYTGVAGGPAAVVAAGVGAILLGGLSALVLVALRRASRSTALPFGPAMVAAAVGVLVMVR